METDEIHSIVKSCQKGDSQAFNQVFDEFGKMLFGIAMRYAKDHAEAEDILQDSFIKIFDKIVSYDFKGSFEGWLKRIVVNTALNKCVKNKSLKESYTMDDIELPEAEKVLSDIGANELLEIINKLPEGYKAVFNMYVVDGYSHKEIAESLEISEGTSKSQLSKAKGMLRKILEQYGVGSSVI